MLGIGLTVRAHWAVKAPEPSLPRQTAGVTPFRAVSIASAPGTVIAIDRIR